jgi:hypothetical protein
MRRLRYCNFCIYVTNSINALVHAALVVLNTIKHSFRQIFLVNLFGAFISRLRIRVRIRVSLLRWRRWSSRSHISGVLNFKTLTVSDLEPEERVDIYTYIFHSIIGKPPNKPLAKQLEHFIWCHIWYWYWFFWFLSFGWFWCWHNRSHKLLSKIIKKNLSVIGWSKLCYNVVPS